ncbi:MAG TPA: sigma-70 family RNA polymerase sigma factor [Candidatus Limnocylindria bacterium]|jgi:RNA polymerase sigma-70 factor (ECF subfamily)|nr:sigma-70 family RNA polymerase sigma factor [Candidatus Limnocylindria bacterium]
MTDPWRELYEHEYARLLRALLAIGGDPDAAEDAAQEAFVKAHRQGLASLERPGAWLLVVGTRELLRHRRRRHVEHERWLERGSATPSAFDAVADRADLLAALRQLPERQRTVVVARYFYGLSYDEIARHFGIKTGTVGATLHQAIEKLRQLQLAGRLARGAMR